MPQKGKTRISSRVLLKPMDEQFLVSCRTIDWSCAPNVLMGAGVMLAAFISSGNAFDPGRAVLFLVMLHIKPDYVQLLWTEPLGIKMSVFALVMQIVGALVIKKIVDIKV